MSNSKNIRLMRSSVIYGPFSADQLRQMASTQKIKSTDLVSVDNGPWKPIKLSANEQQQKPVSQIEKPSKPAEASSEPKAPINAVKLPLLFEKFSNLIVKTLNSFSNKPLNPIAATQSDTPNIPTDPDNANNPSIPTTAKNNFTTALGCGAIILPCLFCGFFGIFSPKIDTETAKKIKNFHYNRENFEIAMTTFDEYPEPVKKAIDNGKDVLELHDAVEIIDNVSKSSFEKYLLYIIIEKTNPVSYVTKYTYNYKNSKSYYYERPTLMKSNIFTRKWEIPGSQIDSNYSIIISTKIDTDAAVVDDTIELQLLNKSSRWLARTSSTTHSKDASLGLPDVNQSKQLRGGSSALLIK
jgi:hypothetical protein